MPQLKVYDEDWNLTYFKDLDDHEVWYDYDKNGNLTHSINSRNYEVWFEHDSNGNVIHSRDSSGQVYWLDDCARKEIESRYNRGHSNE